MDTASALKQVELAYDFMSRRVRKVVSTHDGSAWNQEKDILFVYDGWNLLREQTYSCKVPSADCLLRTDSYVWGLDLSGTLHGAAGIVRPGFSVFLLDIFHALRVNRSERTC